LPLQAVAHHHNNPARLSFSQAAQSPFEQGTAPGRDRTFACAQVSGIEMVPPGRARGDRGAPRPSPCDRFVDSQETNFAVPKAFGHLDKMEVGVSRHQLADIMRKSFRFRQGPCAPSVVGRDTRLSWAIIGLERVVITPVGSITRITPARMRIATVVRSAIISRRIKRRAVVTRVVVVRCIIVRLRQQSADYCPCRETAERPAPPRVAMMVIVSAVVVTAVAAMIVHRLSLRGIDLRGDDGGECHGRRDARQRRRKRHGNEC